MCKVSIIMPVYNTERFVERAVRSALGQTFDDMEIVIVNDATPDGAMEIVRRVVAEYPHRVVKIVEHEINRGIAAARQTGIDTATGEFIQHLDSDDWAELDMVERLYAQVVAADAIGAPVDIVVCDVIVKTYTRDIYSVQAAPATGPEYAREMLDGTSSGSLWNKIIRRSIFVDHGIDFTPGIDHQEDLVFAFKAACNAGRVSYIPVALCYYNRTNETSSTALPNPRTYDSIIRSVDEIERFVSTLPDGARFADALICRKLYVRLILMKAGRRGLYPDIARRYIFRTPAMMMHNKLALLFDSLGMGWGAGAIFKLTDIVKRYGNLGHRPRI